MNFSGSLHLSRSDGRIADDPKIRIAYSRVWRSKDRVIESILRFHAEFQFQVFVPR